MYYSPSLEESVVPCPFLTVASWLAYRFLRRQIRCCGIPISFRILQFVMTHTVKGFGIVNKAEIDVFLELSCFFDDPVDVDTLISGSPAFLNLAWTSGSSLFTYCWTLAWRILSISLLVCEMSAILHWFEHSLPLSFFGIVMKTDIVQSCGHC